MQSGAEVSEAYAAKAAVEALLCTAQSERDAAREGQVTALAEVERAHRELGDTWAEVEDVRAELLAAPTPKPRRHGQRGRRPPGGQRSSTCADRPCTSRIGRGS